MIGCVYLLGGQARLEKIKTEADFFFRWLPLDKQCYLYPSQLLAIMNEAIIFCHSQVLAVLIRLNSTSSLISTFPSVPIFFVYWQKKLFKS